MSKLLLSKIEVLADGKRYAMKDGATLDLGGFSRAAQKSMSRVEGYTEEPMEAKLEGDILVPSGLSLAEIGRITDATITARADTGQTWVLRNAWSATPPVLTGGASGAAKVAFHAAQAEELMN